jgi:hypothetical protein
MVTDPSYERAKRRVTQIKGFFIHLVTYVVVIAFLFFIDVFAEDDPSNWWFYWPALGWGIAVIIHAATVYGPFLGSGWEDRKIKELMDKESKQDGSGTGASK